MKPDVDRRIRPVKNRPDSPQVVTGGRPQAAKSEPLLPHERDQLADATGRQTENNVVIEQAARDIRRGLRDTDLRGIPNDVPGPGCSPEHTPGADVLPKHGDDSANEKKKAPHEK